MTTCANNHATATYGYNRKINSNKNGAKKCKHILFGKNSRLVSVSAQLTEETFSGQQANYDNSNLLLGNWWENRSTKSLVGFDTEITETFLESTSEGQSDSDSNDFLKGDEQELDKFYLKRLPSDDQVNLSKRVVQPLEDEVKIDRTLLDNPQLSEETTKFPLLSSCLSPKPLSESDHKWIEKNIGDIKFALGIPEFENADLLEDSPVKKLDELLFFAYMHR